MSVFHHKIIHNILNYCFILQCNKHINEQALCVVLIDFSLTVKAATLIFISGRCSAISFAKQGKSGSIYNLVKN